MGEARGLIPIDGRTKAEEMLDLNYFGHTRPSGGGADQLIADTGYDLRGMRDTHEFLDTSTESIAVGVNLRPTFRQALMAMIIDAAVDGRGHRKHLLGMTSPFDAAMEVGAGRAEEAEARRCRARRHRGAERDLAAGVRFGSSY